MYHASTDINIAVFEPRNESPRYSGEQDLVFATPYREVAIMFLIPKTIPVEIAKYGDVYMVFVNGTEDELKDQDRGGAIYTLPSDTFETNKTIGMGETEWTSVEPVTPISKQIFNTAIQALNKAHIRTCFLSGALFTQVQDDPTRGLDIIAKL